MTSTVPASGEELARIFKELAFKTEYDPRPQAMRRWLMAGGYKLRFGPSVSRGDRMRMDQQMSNLANTLSDLTGDPLEEATRYDAINVFVVNEGERRTLAPQLNAAMQGHIDPRDVARVVNMAHDEQCLVMAFDKYPNEPTRAIIIIREELPPVLKLACLHEEVSQAFGLTNDSSVADPSIFNDDDQYVTLTAVDKQLLKLLYHPDLYPGMTLETAAPIIDRITASAPLIGG